MGSPLNSVPRTAAEHTASFLQQSADGGSPVLIPGAWETHDGHPGAPPTHGADRPVTRRTDAAAVFDRERLEREREGGGAPRERAGARPPTIFARVWRRLLHPESDSAHRLNAR